MKRFEDHAAVKKVSAYVVMWGEDHVATVRFHNAAALDCEVVSFHQRGRQRSRASGHGYDRETAAVSNCSINGEVLKDGGATWFEQLRSLGYNVIQAI